MAGAGNPENDRLYLGLAARICARIYAGEYPDGAHLPPERSLAEAYQVSRVTVRKALGLLARDGILERVQGSGNRVRLEPAGHPGTLDLIAVLAQAQNVFFAAFMDAFQQRAEARDSLVLFKQNPRGERVEDTLFKLFQKRIRNAVIWLEDRELDLEAVRRLRGLGMNLVCFDAGVASPHVDGVLLDNQDAIRVLHAALLRRNAPAAAYVGWDAGISSVREREAAFRALAPGAPVFQVPWQSRAALAGFAAQLAERLAAEAPGGLICGDGELGVAVRQACLARGLDRTVASPDEYPEARALGLITYRQDFDQMAERTYQCLEAQSRPGWEAQVHRIPGALVAPD